MRAVISLSSLAGRKFLDVVVVRALVQALMTHKSCPVGMRNANLSNHLKSPKERMGKFVVYELFILIFWFEFEPIF